MTDNIKWKASLLTKCCYSLLFISELENALGIKAKKIFLALQPGDVPETFSDINLLKDLTGFSPKISYQEGIKEFVDWSRGYYK